MRDNKVIWLLLLATWWMLICEMVSTSNHAARHEVRINQLSTEHSRLVEQFHGEVERREQIEAELAFTRKQCGDLRKELDTLNGKLLLLIVN